MQPAAPALVTPEAVVLDLRTATVASRSLAKILDVLIELLAGLVAVAVLTMSKASETTFIIVVSFLSFLAVFGYSAAWESLWRGRTPGKAALGLRVVTDEGAPIGPRHAIIRAVLGPVDIVIGVESMLLSSRDRRIGDVVAGTVVLRDKVPGATAAPPFWFTPPPGCETFATSLDTGRLSPADQAVIRSFLLRWWEFDDQSRLNLAAWLAGPLVARLAPRPPAWLAPDLYLLCVMAARQRRDFPGRLPGAALVSGYGVMPPAASGAPALGAPGWGAPASVAPGAGSHPPT